MYESLVQCFLVQENAEIKRVLLCQAEGSTRNSVRQQTEKHLIQLPASLQSSLFVCICIEKVKRKTSANGAVGGVNNIINTQTTFPTLLAKHATASSISERNTPKPMVPLLFQVLLTARSSMCHSQLGPNRSSFHLLPPLAMVDCPSSAELILGKLPSSTRVCTNVSNQQYFQDAFCCPRSRHSQKAKVCLLLHKRVTKCCLLRHRVTPPSSATPFLPSRTCER